MNLPRYLRHFSLNTHCVHLDSKRARPALTVSTVYLYESSGSMEYIVSTLNNLYKEAEEELHKLELQTNSTNWIRTAASSAQVTGMEYIKNAPEFNDTICYAPTIMRQA